MLKSIGIALSMIFGFIFFNISITIKNVFEITSSLDINAWFIIEEYLYISICRDAHIAEHPRNLLVQREGYGHDVCHCAGLNLSVLSI